MKESIYKNYDELPLFLNAVTVAKVLGIAPSSSYELIHEKGFPRTTDWQSGRRSEGSIHPMGGAAHGRN